MTLYSPFLAEVSGGSLAGGLWNERSSEPVTVLAVHGITATHLAWPKVAEQLPGIRMLAPDLRGRGRSNRLPAPWGIRDHADDLARVLDHFGVERAVLLGHSMGGFVAVRLADQHPDRVSAVLLIDGGLPLPTRASGPEHDLPARLLGPAGERLKQSFRSRSEYEQLWRSHPAFAADWSDAVADYANYDLEEITLDRGALSAPLFRPASRYAAVAANIVQMSGDDGYREALAALRVPLWFLRAPRGLLNEIPPLYPSEWVAAVKAQAPRLRVVEAENVNHYTVVMSEHGAAQVADLVLESIAVLQSDAG